jgi:hypothetical protein
MKKIIITGGNGFIGTNLILALLEDKNNKILIFVGSFPLPPVFYLLFCVYFHAYRRTFVSFLIIFFISYFY